jgi:hypothetical protein
MGVLWWVLQSWHPERIRHGVRAVDNPTVLKMIADRGIVLDLALTSNRLTGSVDDPERYLRALRQAGVIVTISTDDPMIMGTTPTAEATLAQQYGFDSLEQFRNAHDAAGCDEQTAVQLVADRLAAGDRLAPGVLTHASRFALVYRAIHGEQVDLYHGTSAVPEHEIRTRGMDPDFPSGGGYGFYVSRFAAEAQARNEEKGTGDRILHFRIPRVVLDALHTTTLDGPALASFMRINRLRQRAGERNVPPFDMIEGPILLIEVDHFLAGEHPVFGSNSVAFYGQARRLLDSALQPPADPATRNP